jgi:hypothetical protein
VAPIADPVAAGAANVNRLLSRPDVIGVDNMMSGSDYPHSQSTFPQSRKILAGVPGDEQTKPAPDPDPGIAGGNTARDFSRRG